MDDKDVAAFMDYLWFMDDKPWDFDEFCVFFWGFYCTKKDLLYC